MHLFLGIKDPDDDDDDDDCYAFVQSKYMLCLFVVGINYVARRAKMTV